MAYCPPLKLPNNVPTLVFTTGSLEAGLGKQAFGIGSYGEDRADVYEGLDTHTGRTVHMGDDIFAPAGTPVFAVADGKLHSFIDNAIHGDYGPTLIVEHGLDDGKVMYALYGHLSRKSLEDKVAGQVIKAGQKIGEVGDKSINGGWAPHVHLQLSWAKPKVCDMPGVASRADFDELKKTYPDPRSILGDIY